MQPNNQQQSKITYSSGVPEMPMNKLSNSLMVSSAQSTSVCSNKPVCRQTGAFSLFGWNVVVCSTHSSTTSCSQYISESKRISLSHIPV